MKKVLTVNDVQEILQISQKKCPSYPTKLT